MKLLHYSAKPIQPLDRAKQYRLPRADKPDGLWVSVGDDWRRWREGEEWGLPPTDHVYRVHLRATAKILVIADERELRRLHQRFPRNRIDDELPFYPDYEKYPSWPAMMEEYDGVIIAPYQWTCRHSVRWYYGWDCASGCIWNLSVIARLTLTATLPQPIREELTA